MPYARSYAEFARIVGLTDGQMRALRRDHGLPRRGPDGIDVDANCREIAGVARSMFRLPDGVLRRARGNRARSDAERIVPDQPHKARHEAAAEPATDTGLELQIRGQELKNALLREKLEKERAGLLLTADVVSFWDEFVALEREDAERFWMAAVPRIAKVGGLPEAEVERRMRALLAEYQDQRDDARERHGGIEKLVG